MCSSSGYENVQTRYRLQPSRSISSVYLGGVCHSCLGLLQSWEWGQTWVILPSRVFPLSNKNSTLVKESHSCSLVGSILTPQPSKSPKVFHNQGMAWDHKTLKITRQPMPVSSDLIKVFTLQVTSDVMEEFNHYPKSHKQMAYFLVSISEFVFFFVRCQEETAWHDFVCAISPCTQGGCWQIFRNKRPDWSLPIVIG